jgi:hypothetical protein
VGICAACQWQDWDKHAEICTFLGSDKKKRSANKVQLRRLDAVYSIQKELSRAGIVATALFD